MSEEAAISIPACQRCKLGKKKCDASKAAPKCSGCVKSSAACIIVDPITGQRHARDYIHRLQLREQHLLRQQRGQDESRSPRLERSGGVHDEAPTPHDSGSSASREFVGEDSGLSFLRSILSSTDLEVQRSHLLRQISHRPQMPEHALQAKHDLPPLSEASALLQNYFQRFHIHHSFFLRADVNLLFEKVYQANADAPCSPQDQFRLMLVFALSAVISYRSGRTAQHPYGYYLGALAWLPQVPLLGSADAILNLLLIARFGMYHHVGISLWDVSYTCMRQCVELGYHRESEWHLSLLEEQKRRRVFWECYILDRYSSCILGRPFAIADEEITIPLPVIANDETLLTSTSPTLSGVADSPPNEPTEVSTFILCIKLRKISSQIHTEFFCGGKGTSHSGNVTPAQQSTRAGHARLKLQRFLEQLNEWRRQAPIFPDPQTLYQRGEYYDFLGEKDKLTLIRGVMNVAPKRGNNVPPADLLAMCIESACRVIHLYADMLEKKYITWTRSYFQVIFMAGLSIVYCISVAGRLQKDDNAMPQAGAVDALACCAKILDTFKREMPDARAFALIFDELAKLVFRKYNLPWPALSRSQAIASTSNTENDGLLSDQYTQPFNADPDLSTAQLPNLDIDLDLDWSITSEVMENIQANLGEYSWGLGSDEWFHWDFFDGNDFTNNDYL